MKKDADVKASDYEFEELELPGTYLIRPSIRRDSRGIFMERWNTREFQNNGLEATFIQENVSVSKKGVIRGLYF